jgi:hypothetical protein
LTDYSGRHIDKVQSLLFRASATGESYFRMDGVQEIERFEVVPPKKTSLPKYEFEKILSDHVDTLE